MSREATENWVKNEYSKSVVGLDRAHMNPNIQKRLSVHQCEISEDSDRHFRAPNSAQHRFSIRKQHRDRMQSAKNFVKPTGATNLSKAERRQRPITRTEVPYWKRLSETKLKARSLFIFNEI